MESFDALIESERTGVHYVSGLMFSLWVLETDLLAGAEEPVLTLFSRVLLRQPRRIIEELVSQGNADILQYVVQQIQLFRRGWEDFIMQHKDVEVMEEIEESLRDAILTVLSPEDRLKGLSPEQVLKHVPVQERLKGLSPEERAELKRLLERDDNPPQGS